MRDMMRTTRHSGTTPTYERVRIALPRCHHRGKRVLSLVWTLILATPSVANARWQTESSATDGSNDRSNRQHVDGSQDWFGPIAVSADAAERVRGHRPRQASRYVNYRRPVHMVDADLRQALALFERDSLHAADSPVPSRNQIPAQWADLELPDLPIRWTPKLIRYLEYLSSEPRGIRLMQGWLQRLGRYEATLSAIMEETGVPRDLVFVALAESGFDPRARSRVGAAGLWQFMEPTGVVYGLQSEYWIDDRFDPIKSTYAAAAYLDDLHTRFGSWELALAAFNAGYGLVAQAVQRNNTNDFWALCEIESGLPYATTNYTPKILAAAIIGRNRERFGFGTKKVEALEPVIPVPVELAGGVRIEQLAKAIDADTELLAELNAHFVRGRTPPKRKSTGYVPKSRLSAFRAASSRFHAKLDGYDVYELMLGDDLDMLAHRFGTTTRALRRINRVFDSGELQPGVSLLVPADEPRSTEETSAKPLAAVPELDVPPDHKVVFFRMTRASTTRTVAAAFGCSHADLLQWNGLDPLARVQTGQMLAVVVRNDFLPAHHRIRAYEADEVERVVRGSLAHLEAELAQRDLVRRGYRVRRGNTLTKIGKRFDLSVGSLARINGFSRSYQPQPGEVITVYVPKNKTRGTVDAPPPRGQRPETTEDIDHALREPSTAETSRVPGTKVRGTPDT